MRAKDGDSTNLGRENQFRSGHRYRKLRCQNGLLTKLHGSRKLDFIPVAVLLRG